MVARKRVVARKTVVGMTAAGMTAVEMKRRRSGGAQAGMVELQAG